MKKTLLTLAAALTMASTALAGGYVTNTNHNAAFLRNPAQDGKIDINAMYPNPAGIGFLSQGWHLSFNIQSAFQHRDVKSNFGQTLAPQTQGLYTLGTVNGERNGVGEKEFKGKAVAPIVPALDLAYVADRWSAMLHFAVGGGGGKCDFEGGLGSFESMAAMLPMAINAGINSTYGAQLAGAGVTLPVTVVDGYSLNSWVKGRQFYYGIQLQGGYKILDNLNVSAGLRGVIASCAYEGYVGDIQVHTSATLDPVVAGALQLPANQYVPASALLGAQGALAADRNVDVSQSGFGLTPIVGVDWRINDQWNIGAKYEFKTRLRLENSTDPGKDGGLTAYADGVKQAADIPALLTVGAQYNPLSNLHLNVGAHLYFDKQAAQFDSQTGLNNKHDKLDGQTWEVLAGVEWDIEDWVTVSAGWQSTNYGLGDNSKYISDMSFVTNSNSIGLGARFNVSKMVAIDVAYFKTLYKHYRVDYEDYNNLGTQFGALAGQPGLQIPGYNEFYRTNDVIGVGVNVKF